VSTLRDVSEPSQSGAARSGATEVRASAAGRVPAASSGDTEEFDALPVLADGATVVEPYPLPGASTTYWRSASAAIPTVQAVAVAATGFVAGAAVVRLVSRRQRHTPARPRARRAPRGAARASAGKRGASKAGELVQIVSSRSLLVDVHLLAGRD